MRVAGSLVCYFSLVVLSGCWGFHTSPQAPIEIADSKSIEKLVGKTGAHVVQELGLPDQKITDGKRTYLIYQARSSGTSFVFMAWVPIAAGAPPNTSIHCIRFELDSSDRVINLDMKHRDWPSSSTKHAPTRFMRCREMYWEYPELLQIRSLPPRSDSKLGRHVEEQIEKLSYKKGKNLYLDVYRDLVYLEPDIAFRFLCRAADLGIADAAETLAELYEDGMKGILKPNYIRAYVWYSKVPPNLDYTSKDKLSSFVEEHLNEDDYAAAMDAFNKWQPGQCDQYLEAVRENG